MINKRTYYFLFFLSFTCVIFNSCHKEEKLFARHIFGHVSDYFDGNDVEGVKVSLVYTYGPFEWQQSPSDPMGYDAPCLPPDTLETTTTDRYGEFSFNYHPKKELDDCHTGIAGYYNYNYYLIFEKKGTDYFKQYEKIINTKNLRKKIEYKLKPLITLEFKISTLTHSGDPAICGISTFSDFDGQYYNLNTNGTNINLTLNHKVPFDKILHTYIEISDDPFTTEYYFKDQITEPTAKYYFYDIVY